MAAVKESQFPTQLQGALRQGLETLDLNQTVTFQTYNRVILPIDGYVFWAPADTFTANGSLHYSQEWSQAEDEAVGMDSIVFTSEGQIQQFTSATQNKIFLATGGHDRYAFGAQGGFYQQASLWHYIGKSINPAMTSQLLDPPITIDLTRAVVCNSLPFWLQLGAYAPIYGPLLNAVPVYPAFEVAENAPPPYIVADIRETIAIQSIPVRTVANPHTQLAQDRVRITLYGFQNNEALDFQDCINQYSLDTDNIGLMNTPVMYDDRRVQTELHGIGMKKTFDIDVSYYQNVSEALSFQLIMSAIPTLLIGNYTA
ncbi:MAG: hypothetical protein ACRESI_06500 [Gammaproteobacteria bacterium]